MKAAATLRQILDSVEFSVPFNFRLEYVVRLFANHKRKAKQFRIASATHGKNCNSISFYRIDSELTAAASKEDVRRRGGGVNSLLKILIFFWFSHSCSLRDSLLSKTNDHFMFVIQYYYYYSTIVQIRTFSMDEF